MTSSSKRILTPEQIALSEARKVKKQRPEQSKVASLVDKAKGKFFEREWIQLASEPSEAAKRVRVATWNLLAQTLVRRDLFPTSNCLKAGQREHMIYCEILAQDADILCLQEVDRLEKLLPVLENAGYSHRYGSGPAKKHGCLIAFKKSRFTEIHSSVIQYDNEYVRDTGNDQYRRGSSFKTKNIGLVVALREHDSTQHAVVATTHLFWHPRYTYERARQAGILKRAVLAFQRKHSLSDSPTFICGDFNFAPDDAAYSLMVGDPLLDQHKSDLAASGVVHITVDPSISKTAADDGQEGDPDRTITNARKARDEDGLLSPAELTALFKTGSAVQSMYDLGLQLHRQHSGNVKVFGDRVNIPSGRKGANEPEWTSYTHYWKTVLDYIFVMDPKNQISLTGVRAPHTTATLESGLPQQGICGSDHVLLAAEVALISTQ